MINELIREGKVVEPLVVPKTSKPGDRLFFTDEKCPPDEELNPKKKVWEKLSADFKTNEDGEVMWKDRYLLTPSGERVMGKLQNCFIK